MNRDLEGLREKLARQWCESFASERFERGLVISTSFLYPDGDALPVFIEPSDEGWLIRDRGATLAHFFFDDYTLSDSRLDTARRLAGAGDAYLEGFEILRTFRGTPDAYDIAEFLTTLSQVAGLPALVKETTKRFTTRAREHVLGWGEGPGAEPDWTPNHRNGKLYPTDLWLPAPQPVVTWFVGDATKAERTSLSAMHYRQWEVDAIPIAAYRKSVFKGNSSAVARMEESIGDSGLVVAVEDNGNVTDLGYAALRRAYRQAGVALAA